jgi:hypothetical protein
VRGQQEEWWKTRGGHELYDIFDRIDKENPMAARAFWDSVVGTGRGMNDLQAATIHKRFGGDMNAYNNWRNQYANNNLESYAGNFDLQNGRWTPGQGFNSDYVRDRTGMNVSGPWQASWNWGDYRNNLQTGLQSLPGQAEAGAESWNTYLGGADFSNQGVHYGPTGASQSVKPNVAAIKGPGGAFSPTGVAVPNPNNLQTAAGPGNFTPSINREPNPSVTVPSAITPTNPTGNTGGYRFKPNPGDPSRVWRNQ